jgi:hypothetical protein
MKKRPKTRKDRRNGEIKSIKLQKLKILQLRRWKKD